MATVREGLAVTEPVREQSAGENGGHRADENPDELFEHAPCGLLSALLDGTIMRVNQTFLTLIGRSREDLLAGCRVQDLMTEPGSHFHQAQLPALLQQQGAAYAVPCELRRQAQTPLPALFNCSESLAAHGTPLRRRYAFFDATEQAHARARLLESEAQFRTIFELAPAGVVLIDPATSTILACNDEAARANGYTRAEFVGRSVLEVIAPSLHPQSLQRRERILADGGAQYDSRHVTRTGQLRDVHVKVRVVSIGGATGMLSVWEDITERRKAEAALRESQARLALGGRVAGLALADIDYSRGLIELSEEAARLFGIGECAMSVPRDALHATFHPEDRAAVLQQIEATLDPASTGWFAMDVRVVWPQGQVRWLRTRKQVFFDDGEDGQRRPRSALIAALDITAEKAADEAVRASEQRFRSIFDNAAVGMAHVSLEGRFLRVNHRLCQIIGYDATELACLSVVQVLHAEDAAANLEPLQRLRDGDIDTHAREERYVRKDGALVWASVTLSLLRTPAGAPLHFIAAVEDISARKAALQALEQERQFIERLTDVVPSILYVFDIHRQSHVWVNRQAGAALGFPPQTESPWGPDFRLQNIHPDDLAWVNQQTAQLAQLHDGQTHETEYRLRHQDGSWRWFRSRESVFKRDHTQRVLQVIGVASDIDASKRAEQALRDADSKKDAFIATLAHELRNPLAPIRNAVRLMRQKGAPDPEMVWCRDIIERQVAQMAHLLEDLLDVSRITQGRLALRREALDVGRVLEQAVEIAQPWISARGHDLVLVLPSPACTVDGDLTRLAQIFSNLLINAAKYTPEGGRIQLQASGAGAELRVTVSDNGSGIAPQQLAQIFEMFSRGGAAQAGTQDGLGIGLSLVRGLVELHGGRVTASSPGLGLGSEFRVQLPLKAPVQRSAHPPERPLVPLPVQAPLGLPLQTAPASVVELHTTPALGSPQSTAAGAAQGQPPPTSTPEPPGQATAAPLRLLVADDSADIADTLRLLLELEGFEVQVAYNGEQALQLAQARPPDVALLDLGMPGLDGLQLARQLRAQPWGAALTLIAQTGWGQDADRQRSREAGFDHHVVKPVDPEALIGLLHQVGQRLAQQRGARALRI